MIVARAVTLCYLDRALRMAELPPKQISIVYEKVSLGKPTVAATGAFGGPSPDHHSVVAHLFVEHPSIPSIISHRVRDDNTIDFEHGDSVSRGDVTREIQTTLVLSPEAAILIGNWLVKHGVAAAQGRGSIKPDEDNP